MAPQNDRSMRLFTPGPLSTSLTVKQAALEDVFPRSDLFSEITADIQRRILALSGASPDEWSTIIVQGCGTYSLEAMIHTAVPKFKEAKALLLHNGFYANRFIQICEAADISYDVIKFGDALPFDLKKVEEKLQNNKYSAVVLVHCETSSGIVNPVEEVARMTRSFEPTTAVLVDAMSSFSVIPLSFDNLDFVVSSANKAMQGIPGFSFVLARVKRLMQCKGNERTLCFNLVAQHEDLQNFSQFRFTPPSHVMLAAQQALKEYESEGGPEARRKRYQNNATTLVTLARQLGFKTLLPDEELSPIVTSFLFPNHPKFELLEFSRRIWDKGFVIFPGKLLDGNSFRIGTIGDIFPSDVKELMAALEAVLKDMGIPVPVP